MLTAPSTLFKLKTLLVKRGHPIRIVGLRVEYITLSRIMVKLPCRTLNRDGMTSQTDKVWEIRVNMAAWAWGITVRCLTKNPGSFPAAWLEPFLLVWSWQLGIFWELKLFSGVRWWFQFFQSLWVPYFLLGSWTFASPKGCRIFIRLCHQAPRYSHPSIVVCLLGRVTWRAPRHVGSRATGAGGLCSSCWWRWCRWLLWCRSGGGKERGSLCVVVKVQLDLIPFHQVCCVWKFSWLNTPSWISQVACNIL